MSNKYYNNENILYAVQMSVFWLVQYSLGFEIELDINRLTAYSFIDDLQHCFKAINMKCPVRLLK